MEYKRPSTRYKKQKGGPLKRKIFSLFLFNSRTLIALSVAFLFSAGVAFATPPTTPYNQNETLDPSCGPTDTNCYVAASSGSSAWSSITGTPTTLSGYGITDAYTKTASDGRYEVPLSFGTGLTRTSNAISVNPSQNISTLSNLTANGIVTTSGGTGALSITSTSGSGNVALTTSPTFITPILGAATATSINGNIITTGTGTLTLGAGKILTASNTLTLSGTDGSTLNIGVGGTLGSNAFTGTAYAPLATPVFTTNITSPLILGGSSTTSPLALRSTSGVGATGADIIFQTGNNGATEAMRILNNGNVGIGTSNPTTKLVSSYNAASVTPNFPASTGLQIVGANTTPVVEEIDTFAEHGLLEVRRANGTPAAPTGLLANDHISSFAAGGYGTTQYNAEASANIAMFADENWTDTAHGSFIYFDTTPDGTTNLTPVAKVEQNGNYDVSGNMIVGQLFGASLFGYTSPVRVLSVIGPSSTTSRGVLELASGALNTSNTSGEIDFDATSQTLASNYRLAQIYGTPVGSTTGNVGGSLTFTTKADGGSLTPRMTIGNTGTVSIPGLSTNGLVKTSGGTGALSIATANTDYQSPITVTATGSSGAATFNGTTLNIPQYADGSGTVTSVATDSTLTGGAITTSGTLGLNLANANIFTGAQTINKTAIATTSTDGLTLENTTAATSGVTVQYSPRLHFIGQAWNTGGTPATNTDEWIAELRPGSANPTSSKLVFSQQTAGGGYVDVLTLNSSGTVSTGSANNGAINVGAITSTSTLITGSSNGNIWVPAATAATSTATAQYQFAGSSTSFLRTGVYGNSIATVLTAGAPYGSFVVGASPVSVAATGTQPLLANMVVTALGTVTNSSAIPITNTASLYVDGAGSGGSNNYALYVNSGNTALNGGLTTNGTSLGADAILTGGAVPQSTTVASLLFAGASTIHFRVAFNGNSSSTLIAGTSYANTVIGSSPITAAATGTHALLANEVINSLGTVTNASSVPITNTASLYIGGASSAGTNNYGALFNSGTLATMGNISAPAWGVNGINEQHQAATYTDSSSPTGTTTNNMVNTFGIPTLAASNTSVVYTNAATLYIAGAPANGTNVTQTFPMALYVGSGLSSFAGGLATSANAIGSNLDAIGGQGSGGTSSAGVLFAGAANVSGRVFLNGTSSTTVPANSSYSNLIVGSSPVSANSTGTHALLANMVVNPIGTVTNASSVPITNTASLYINGAGSGGTNNYGALFNSGTLATMGNISAPAWGVNGINEQHQAATYTDTSSSGVVASNMVNSFGIPTLAASPSATTYSSAATLYIAGAPVAGTNVAISNAYSLFVNSGLARLAGGFDTGSGSSSTIYIPSGTGTGRSATAGIIFGGSTTVSYRALFNGGTSSVLTSGDGYGNVVVASAAITAAATGTHALLANMVVNPLGTVTNASSIPITNTASLYIGGASAAGTNNYALDVASGNSVFGGQIGATTLAAGTANSLCYSTSALSGFNTLSTCSSDERLKQNITPLSDDVLTNIMKLNPVSFNWNPTFSADQTVQFGLIAQQVAQVFPNLVSKTAPTPLTPDGTYSLNFNGLYGPIIKSIQEMNLSVTNINDLTQTNTWRDSLLAWFGNTANGIQKFVADEISAKKVSTDTLCVGQVCVTQEQFLQMVQHDSNSAPVITPSAPDTTPSPAPDQTPDTTPAPAPDDTTIPPSDPTTLPSQSADQTVTSDPAPSTDSTSTPPADPTPAPTPDPAPAASQ